MILAALLLTQSHGKNAQTVLFETLAHYQTLDSFSASIEHDESSGLFPGKYAQKLSWKKGGHFELVVVKPQVYKPKSARRNNAPNYYANGQMVTSVYSDGRQRTDTIQNEPNETPGWDVSGGLIMSFLQKTNTETIFRNPPRGFTMTYSFGTQKRWRGEAVRDILMTFGTGKLSHSANVYLAANAPKLLGFTVSSSPDHPAGYMYYRDQKENPSLAANLGTVPSK